MVMVVVTAVLVVRLLRFLIDLLPLGIGAKQAGRLVVFIAGVACIWRRYLEGHGHAAVTTELALA
jgi:hypothetical protein